VEAWAFGEPSIRHTRALEAVREAGLEPQVALWHQGESDRRTSRDAYARHLQVVIDRTRHHFPGLPFGIALASLCRSHPEAEAESGIRAAQRLLANSHEGNFISADSDSIDQTRRHRYDGCHFAREGSRRLSSLYHRSLETNGLLESLTDPRTPADRAP
jgi:hypothetical protein